MWNTAVSDKKIYLDYAATAPTDKNILKKMMPYFSDLYGNPSSLHSSGRRASQIIVESRKKVADILNVLPEEIIFTGSGTESDNLAIIGIARANREHGNHIIVPAIEHKAILESVKELKKEGFEITILPVKSDGIIDVKECINSIKEGTILISIMYANNEIGAIEPIQQLSRAIKTRRGSGIFPIFHTDACQAAGFLSLDVNELGVDSMTLNGSKIYGPKGVGALYVKKNIRLNPIIVGGEQEKNQRAGTESVPLIFGFGEALVKADKMRKSESKRLKILRDYFIKKLAQKIPKMVLNGHKQNRLPNNIHFSIPHIEGESMLLMLDKMGIEASTGSACSAFDLKPSHVLTAIGQNPDLIHGSIRFSLGRDTTKKKLDYVLSVFPDIVEKLSKMSASK